MTKATTTSQDHPAPHRDRARPAGLILALALSPAGWITQLTIDYGLSSFACYPSDAPLRSSPPPGWGGEHLLLTVVNLACLVFPVAGGWLAFSAWRRTRNEKPGDAKALLEVGEGRTRFLATSALMAAGGFTLAIVFNTASALAVPTCWNILR